MLEAKLPWGRLTMDEKGGKLFDRYLQSCVSVLGVGVLIWVGTSVNYLRESAATTAVEVTYIKSELQYMKKMTTSLYTRSDARADLLEVKAKINKIEERIRHLETKGN